MIPNLSTLIAWAILACIAFFVVGYVLGHHEDAVQQKAAIAAAVSKANAEAAENALKQQQANDAGRDVLVGQLKDARAAAKKSETSFQKVKEQLNAKNVTDYPIDDQWVRYVNSAGK